MPAPLIRSVTIDVGSNLLIVVVARSVTDELTNTAQVEQREVSGPLNALAGLGTLRTNLIAWVKAQSGYAGTVDIAP